jgi:hypothetical protein
MEEARARLRAAGWTDRDIAELVRRRGEASLLLPPHPLPPVLDGGGAHGRVLHKVRALLAKAESTNFPEEAEALSAKAQELMTRHRIDHLGGALGAPGGRRIWIDAPYVAPKAGLAMAVARANGCRGVHLVGLGCVHVVGFPDDLASTEVLFTSLLVQAGRAMASAGGASADGHRNRTRSFRHAFLVGYAGQVGRRLRETSDTLVAGRGDLLPVVQRRDAEVEAALALAFPRTTTHRPTVSNRAGWAAGVRAADAADIGRRRMSGLAGELGAGGVRTPSRSRRAG